MPRDVSTPAGGDRDALRRRVLDTASGTPSLAPGHEVVINSPPPGPFRCYMQCSTLEATSTHAPLVLVQDRQSPIQEANHEAAASRDGIPRPKDRRRHFPFRPKH